MSIRVADFKREKYKDAEEQGLVLMLPCKVGDTIWDNEDGLPIPYEVMGFSLGNLENFSNNDLEVHDKLIVYIKSCHGGIRGSLTVDEIGKTVFLTKEEAEQALAELKEV